MTGEWRAARSDGSEMPVYVSAPAGDERCAAVLVIQHQGGVDRFIQQITDRLARHGYLAAAPDLYHRDGPNCKDDIAARRARLSDRRIIRDIDAAVDLLRAQRRAASPSLGIIGFCMGGRLALLGAATNQAFEAAVAFYPSNMFRAWGRDLASPFERLRDIACAIQGHFGTEDSNPSPADMAKLEGELRSLKTPHEFFTYPKAGHAFMDAGKESYRPSAEALAWPRTLDFFGRHLGSTTEKSAAH